MKKLPVMLIFDIGKTNKKLLLFDEDYHVVHETSIQLNETTDEDNFPCEDVLALTHWMKDSFNIIAQDNRFNIRAINFSGYGASFVLLDEKLKPILPLYNYLKPYPEQLQQQFYNTYGGQSLITKQTASPVLGSLNSGMQLYLLKYERPEIFKKIKYALHLPQYLSFIFTGKVYSEVTSIGCHTHLWNFQQQQYHKWVIKEGVDTLLPPIVNSNTIGGYINKNILVGVGLHDSSAALIPYHSSFTEPFVLLSTGTWCISLNPFNHTSLSDEELKNDCLMYLSYKGEAIKASRLFAGHEFNEQVNRIATYFHQSKEKYFSLLFDKKILDKCIKYERQKRMENQLKSFQQRNLSEFENDVEAYYQLLINLVTVQVASTQLILKVSPVKKLFVDGGFSSNVLFMKLLADSFPQMSVYAAEVPQAAALGAALIMHEHWNKKSFPEKFIQLKRYFPSSQSS